MRRLMVLIILVSCWAAALVPAAVADKSRPTTVRWRQRDVRVSDSKAQFKGDQKTLFETSVAIDPTDPRNMIGFAIDLSVQNMKPRLWSVTRAYRSTDGGQTWRDLGPMRYTKGRRDTTSSGDPVAVFDGRGNAYYASLAHPPGRPDGIYVHRSADAGKTWSVPVAAVKATKDTERDVCTGTDKEWLEADRKTGKLYLAYTLFTFSCTDPGLPTDTVTRLSDLGIYLTSSVDHGKTWSKPREIWSGYALGAMPRVGPDGTLYVAFWGTVAMPPTACPTALGVVAAKGGGRPFASIIAGSSKDGGKTWNFHVQPICDFIVGEFLKPGSFVGGSIVPSVDVDPATGAAYVAYPSFLSSGDRFTIDLISSQDGGKTWSGPVEVTPGPADARVPALSADDGVVRLTYVESTGLRDQDSETADGETRTMYTESLDGGGTWSKPFALSTKVGHPTEYTELGDYNTLAVEGDRIAALWTDARNPRVNGEIWARVGTVVRGGGRATSLVATASGGAATARAWPALMGIVPSSAPSHRALVASSSSMFAGTRPCRDASAKAGVVHALRRGRDISFVVECNVRKVLATASRLASRSGFKTVFSDYEGFEGELLLRKRRRIILVKVVSRSRGEVALTAKRL